jgi:hypothetical protein
MAQEYIQTMENFYQRADLPLQSLAVKKLGRQNRLESVLRGLDERISECEISVKRFKYTLIRFENTDRKPNFVIPSPFSSSVCRRRKKQALANIHYVAGMLVMAVDWLLARRHFTHSIRYYPFSLGCSQMGLRRSWLLMLRVVRFPHVFNKLLNKRLWSGVKSLLRRTT